jgi:hypothetical protein
MPITRCRRVTVTAGLLLAVAACGGSSGSANPTAPSQPGGTTGGITTLKMYTASSPTGPWTTQTATVTGHDALGLVDLSPIRMPDGRILMYYLMSYQASGDPARVQPNNQWKIGVAQSSDGQSFTHRGVAYTGSSSTTDPFPLLLDSGLVRLYMSPGGPSVLSVTSTDNTGLNFSASLDPGMRATMSGVPGALRIGSTYFLYVNGITYLTSADGLNFSPGGSTGLSTGSPSPIDAGDGTYLMAYVCSGTTFSDHTTCMGRSTDGRTWTSLGTVGSGSVPGLVKDAGGTLRVYTAG